MGRWEWTRGWPHRNHGTGLTGAGERHYALQGRQGCVRTVDTNALGDRGESLFRVAATGYHGDNPLFRIAFPGEKWPWFDFVGEPLDAPGRLFLVQVRTTRTRRKTDGRIGLRVHKKHVETLISAPVPVYLAAVDERSEEVFIVRPSKGRTITSVAPAFSLRDPAVREMLKDEVVNYWTSVDPSRRREASSFRDEG